MAWTDDVFSVLKDWSTDVNGTTHRPIKLEYGFAEALAKRVAERFYPIPLINVRSALACLEQTEDIRILRDHRMGWWQGFEIRNPARRDSGRATMVPTQIRWMVGLKSSNVSGEVHGLRIQLEQMGTRITFLERQVAELRAKADSGKRPLKRRLSRVS